MYRTFLPAIALVFFAALPGGAQVFERKAALVGGGDMNQGRCTVEVVVDGAADVEIHGDTAVMRNVWGQSPEWRRFVCTAPMPASAANIRFQGEQGRGTQRLVSSPANGGPLVVHIEDSEGGRSVYTFDVFWNGNMSGNMYRNGNNTAVVSSCRDRVRRDAANMYGTSAIDFADTNFGDNGRISGTFFLQRDRDHDQPYRYSCAVDMASGRVRWAQVESQYGGSRYNNNSADRSYAARDAVQTCQSEVNRQIRQRGYSSVQFGDIHVDDHPGSNDRVVGNLRAGDDHYNFSCRVDLNDGDVRSVDLSRQ
jgi:hypothetical protein